MNPKWRLLDTGYRSCSENIALDKVLLLDRSRGSVPDTLRFFQFKSPCVLTGFYQIAEQEIRLDYCRQQGIEINRRITGGNTAYWDDSTIGWEVVVAGNSPAVPGQSAEAAAKLWQACKHGLARLGIDANCKTSGVIEAAGCQIGWAGGTEYEGIVLYQGYIRVNELNVNRMLRALRLPTEKLKNKAVASVEKSITCVKRIVGETYSKDDVKAALTEGFAQVLGVSLVAGGLTAAEEDLYAANLADVSTANWITGESSQGPARRQELRYTFKEESLINVALLTDERLQEIQAVSFSGDFCAYPLQFIRQLAVRLHGVPVDLQAIRTTIQECFQEHHAHIPGLSPESFSQAIMQALAKREFTGWNVYPDEVNDLCIVGNPSGEDFAAMALQSIPFLLPYCAKKVACKFRYTQGCGRCGQCDIGKAYQLADKYGLEPITIQNFEMLEDQLASLKKKGCQAFIGICCEAFWVKHRHDFERIGLPGILINVDNSTCYDLGKEQAAYEGNFENQTRLKHELIQRILNNFFEHDERLSSA